MSKGNPPPPKRPRPDLFDVETVRKTRPTPEPERLEVNTAPRRAEKKSEIGDTDWLAEVLPGEKQPGRTLFDDATIRRLRLTPEASGGEPEFVHEPADQPSFWFWPSVSDIELARSAATWGTSAALLLAVGSLILAGLLAADVGFLKELGFESSDALPAAFGATAYMAIGWGIHCMSRIAAVLGLVLYLLDRIAQLIEFGPRVASWFVSIVFVVAFANAVRGTFAYHQLVVVDSHSSTLVR